MFCSWGLLLRGYCRQVPRLIQWQVLIQVPQWGVSWIQRPLKFQYSGSRSPRTCFLRSDCRLRLPHPCCRGPRQRTRRLPSHPTGYVRGTLRMFRTRVVCLMCHRFHKDSLFGLLGRAEQPHLKFANDVRGLAI